MSLPGGGRQSARIRSSTRQRPLEVLHSCCTNGLDVGAPAQECWRATDRCSGALEATGSERPAAACPCGGLPPVGGWCADTPLVATVAPSTGRNATKGCTWCSGTDETS